MAHNVFVFVPAFRQIISATTFLTVCSLQQQFQAKGIGGGVSTLSFPDIAELRSMALTMWYDTFPDSTHILFVDDDMGFSPQLVLDMLMFNEPVVGTIYPQRKLPISWAGSGTGEATAQRRADFMKVEGVGMGCTLIRRDAVTTMLEKLPEIVDTRLQQHPAQQMLAHANCNRLIRAFEKIDDPVRGIISEDLSFCIRWGKCGGDVWANVGHKISHVGPFDFAARYLDGVEAAEKQAAEQQRLAAEAEKSEPLPAEHPAELVAAE